MNYDTQMFIERAILKALKENPNYQAIADEGIVTITLDYGSVKVSDHDE